MYTYVYVHEEIKFSALLSTVATFQMSISKRSDFTSYLEHYR